MEAKMQISYIIMAYHNPHQQSVGREGSDLEGIREGVSGDECKEVCLSEYKQEKEGKDTIPCQENG